MSAILKYLNENQGAVLAVLTALSVLTTLAVVWVMMRANKLTAKSLERALGFERRRSRPYVVFNIVTSGQGYTYASLKNVGLTSAYYIRVSIEPKVIYQENGEDKDLALTSHPLPFLPPGEEVTDLIDDSAVFLERYRKTHSFKGFVEYQDSPESDAVRYKEELLIDLSLKRKRSLLPEQSLAAELKEVNLTLTEISRRLGEQ
jgi:hypothetical protein